MRCSPRLYDQPALCGLFCAWRSECLSPSSNCCISSRTPALEPAFLLVRVTQYLADPCGGKTPFPAERYSAANRLLRDRTAGEQCAAAEAVIDQELGL